MLKVLGIPPGLKKKKFPRVMSTACPARMGVPRAVLTQPRMKKSMPWEERVVRGAYRDCEGRSLRTWVRLFPICLQICAGSAGSEEE